MEEMYGEPFQVPSPDETLFTSWFEGEKHLDLDCYIKEEMVKYFILDQDT